jgi:two-component system, OmpR family, alkaline phosphatase synthesis response regulator PhoP
VAQDQVIGGIFMALRILVVDDEAQIVRVLRGYLEKAGYAVLTAHDGPEALRIARQEKPDLMILDLMLPGMDGIDVCKSLRQESTLPILMLTARVEEADRIIGLELGADDYVTKPFSPREVVARVRTILRRTRPTPEVFGDVLRMSDLSLDTSRHTVTLGEEQIEITPSEFQILEAMIRAPGRVFTREHLLEAAQGVAYAGYERTIDTHIKNLRRKIEKDPHQPTYLLTVHGVGYKMREG